MKKRWIILIVLVLLVVLGWYNLFVPHGSAPGRKLAEYKKQLIAQGRESWILHPSPVRPHRIQVSRIPRDNFWLFCAYWSIPRSVMIFTPAMKMMAPGAATGDRLHQLGRKVNGELRIRTKSERPSNCGRSCAERRWTSMWITHAEACPTPRCCRTLPQIKPPPFSWQLSETARQALHERDFDEAALDLGAEADMLRLLSQEPVLISSLVRIAMRAHRHCRNDLGRLCNTRVGTNPQLSPGCKPNGSN